jgi:hypothetical protein
MAETLLGFLAFAVFGLLWLVHQDWFEFLPRRVVKSVSAFAGAFVVVTCLFVPSAFRAGFMRFTDYLAASVTSEMRHVVDRIGNAVPVPTRAPSPPASPPAIH